MKYIELSLKVSILIGFPSEENFVYYELERAEFENLSSDLIDFLYTYFKIILLEEGDSFKIYYSEDNEIEKIEAFKKNLNFDDKYLISEFLKEFINQEGIKNKNYFSIIDEGEIEED